MFWSILKKILFLFDAESVHTLCVGILRGLGRSGIQILFNSQKQSTHKPLETLNMKFLNPIGLAAGFDKNAELIDLLPSLGFGFAEIGTVTPLPQPGNPRPRLFRDPARSALFNRMGFNSLGATQVAKNLSERRNRLPESFRVGVNLGKNKDTPNEKAVLDYQKAVIPFEGLVDYIVINVSSPNTPGLRSLQTVENLVPIVESVKNVTNKWTKTPPLLLKLAPEFDYKGGFEMFSSLEARGIDGWVLTNTLAGEFGGGSGGWSGSPVQSRSREALSEILSQTQKPVISVGGIDSLEEAQLRLRMGARLIQIYTGWIYQGPQAIFNWVKHL